jgi:hypothetical protein
MTKETRAYFGCVLGIVFVISLTLGAIYLKWTIDKSPELQAWVRAISPFDGSKK